MGSLFYLMQLSRSHNGVPAQVVDKAQRCCISSGVHYYGGHGVQPNEEGVGSAMLSVEKSCSSRRLGSRPERSGWRYVRLLAVSVVLLGAGINTVHADDDIDLWAEVQKGGTRDDYQVYLDQFPTGKFTVLARSRMNRIDAAKTEKANQQEQSFWNAIQKNPSASGYKSYLSRYPRGRYANEAQELAKRAPQVPPRPVLPAAVAESVWQALEASQAYLNWPQPRKVNVTAQGQVQTEYTGAKSSSLPKPKPYGKADTREFTPLGGKCTAMRMGFAQQNINTAIETTICGPVSMAGAANGKANTLIKSVDIKGSLFPMAVGAEQSVVEVTSNLSDAKFDMTISRKCRVTGQIQARELHARLTGIAWTMNCDQNIQMPGLPSNSNMLSTYEDYFLEEIGTFVSFIGSLDMVKKKFILPTQGAQTAIVAAGDYGSTTTTTYQSYDWTVGD
jgi:hypothetical protein